MLAPIDSCESSCASTSPILKLRALADPEKLANPIARGKAARDQACIFFVIVLLRLGNMNLCINRHLQDTAESVMIDARTTCPQWPIRLSQAAIHRLNALDKRGEVNLPLGACKRVCGFANNRDVC